MKTITKIIALGAFLAFVPSTTALAACGVGSTIWEGHEGMGAKILAFTTNFWTFKALSTTFEISDCDASDNIFKKVASLDEKIYDYANQNLDHLAVDMARGRGEYVDVFAHLMGMSDQHSAELRILAQQNFGALFPHDYVTTREVLLSLRRLMVESPELSVYVTS